MSVEPLHREVLGKDVLTFTHIYDSHCPPYVRTLCGIDWAPNPGEKLNFGSDPVDCVVCSEMERQVNFCSRCGVRLEHRR